jgi:hypothetical protein
MNRPDCPVCRGPVHTARHVPGGVSTVYPCSCWLVPADGDAVARELERLRAVRR